MVVASWCSMGYSHRVWALRGHKFESCQPPSPQVPAYWLLALGRAVVAITLEWSPPEKGGLQRLVAPSSTLFAERNQLQLGSRNINLNPVTLHTRQFFVFYFLLANNRKHVFATHVSRTCFQNKSGFEGRVGGWRGSGSGSGWKLR